LKKPTYSLISPTFKRPDEVTEFLESLLEQNHQSFEVILGDGTPGDELRPLLKRFEDNPVYPLTIVYKEFLPVSNARNEAASVARGDYFIFLDSDCLIPPNYLNELDIALAERPLDLFGGPDAAREDFSNLQKAISYAMTATLTTGGIRGKEKHVGTYHPRGFNMGVSRQAFEAVGGYDTAFVCGEDVELSIRIIEAGFTSGFIPNAYVYHKRRTTLTKFYRQVFRFGAPALTSGRRIRLNSKRPISFRFSSRHLRCSAFWPYRFLAPCFSRYCWCMCWLCCWIHRFKTGALRLVCSALRACLPCISATGWASPKTT
jgi:GT2 family glycosyltransferase